MLLNFSSHQSAFSQVKAELSAAAGDDIEDGGEGDDDEGAWLDEPPLVSVVFCRCSPNNLPQVIDFNPPQFGSGEKASPVKEATEKAGPVKEAAEKALETGGEPVCKSISLQKEKKTQAPNHEVIRLHDGAIKQRWDFHNGQ